MSIQPAIASEDSQLEHEFATTASTVGDWFDYPIRVHPHHTDYAGIVWHGTYITWLEEARVDYLRSHGVDYSDWVALGCDLPVVDLAVKYIQPMRMGMRAIVRTKMLPIQGVRIPWEYQIQSEDGQEIYVTAQVTLVPLSRETGKIMRRLPPMIQETLKRMGCS